MKTNEIQIKKSLENNTKNATTKLNNVLTSDKLVNELNEQRLIAEKKNNVIVFCVPESTNIEERIQINDDKIKLEKMFNYLGLQNLPDFKRIGNLKVER